MQAAVLLLLGVICGVAIASGDLVIGVYTDSACTSIYASVSSIPTYAKNGTCTYAPGLSSYFIITTRPDGSATFGLQCTTSSCSVCGASGSSTVGVCTLASGLYILAYPTTVETVSVTLRPNVTSINTTQSVTTQTCPATNSGTSSLNLGACVAVGSAYQIATRVSLTGAKYSFAVAGNCTNVNCTSCTFGGFYSSSSTCYTALTSSGISYVTIAGSTSTSTSTSGSVSGTSTHNATTSSTSTSGSSSGTSTTTSGVSAVIPSIAAVVFGACMLLF